MVRRPPTRSSVLIAILLLVAFVAWTWLTFNSAALAGFDQLTLAPPLDPGSRTAEIAGAFALLTWLMWMSGRPRKVDHRITQRQLVVERHQ